MDRDISETDEGRGSVSTWATSHALHTVLASMASG